MTQEDQKASQKKKAQQYLQKYKNIQHPKVWHHIKDYQAFKEKEKTKQTKLK